MSTTLPVDTITNKTLLEIFKIDNKFEISIEGEENKFSIRCSRMYYYPFEITTLMLMDLVSYFGTVDINIDSDKLSDGCETCDYGSNYEHTIYVHNATRNFNSAKIEIETYNKQK